MKIKISTYDIDVPFPATDAEFNIDEFYLFEYRAERAIDRALSNRLSAIRSPTDFVNISRPILICVYQTISRYLNEVF